jgi:hypothetical protein
METLSVCMIVQNREALLPITLESLGGIYDELIVVDGGSTDRTCEICLDYGATLIHSQWNHHYAQQRNVYLRAATTDWIFAIDSDEFIDKKTLYFLHLLKLRGEKFRPALFFLPRRWLSPQSLSHYITSPPHYPDGQARIFRPEGLSYKGRVHAIPYGAPREQRLIQELGLYHLDLFISSEEQRRAKVASYSRDHSRDGAPEFYLPQVSSLQLSPWNWTDILPAVQARLRSIDPQLPLSDADAIDVLTPQQVPLLIDRRTFILFPAWQPLDEASFYELVTAIGWLASRSEQQPTTLLVYGGIHTRLITTILTNAATELAINQGLQIPKHLHILIIQQLDAAMKSQILEAAPIHVVLTNEQQPTIAEFGAAALPTQRLDRALPTTPPI